jgi:GNAT superfamily N-acetyltransferase
MTDILDITADEALWIRHQVLWPDKPAEFCRVEGDDQAVHLGGFVNNQLVSALSLFDKGSFIQLRKFATLQQHQGQGHGTALMRAAMDRADGMGKPIRLHARSGAIAFYERHGFTQQGEPFQKYSTETSIGPTYNWMQQTKNGT